MIRRMTTETNDRNLGNLINLTEHFYLTSHSQNRCIEAIQDTEWPWFWNLEHNGQHRIFKQIEADAQHDSGFMLYRDLLHTSAAYRGTIHYSRQTLFPTTTAFDSPSFLYFLIPTSTSAWRSFSNSLPWSLPHPIVAIAAFPSPSIPYSPCSSHTSTTPRGHLSFFHLACLMRRSSLLSLNNLLFCKKTKS